MRSFDVFLSLRAREDGLRDAFPGGNSGSVCLSSVFVRRRPGHYLSGQPLHVCDPGPSPLCACCSFGRTGRPDECKHRLTAAGSVKLLSLHSRRRLSHSHHDVWPVHDILVQARCRRPGQGTADGSKLAKPIDKSCAPEANLVEPSPPKPESVAVLMCAAALLSGQRSGLRRSLALLHRNTQP